MPMKLQKIKILEYSYYASVFHTVFGIVCERYCGQMNKGLRDQTEILKSLFTLRAGLW